MSGSARFIAALAAASILAAAGCGGSDDDSSSGGDSTAGGSGTTTEKTKDWPIFGRVAQRIHYLDANGLNPPLKEVWEFSDKVLLEFPPALVKDRLFVADKYGNVRALDAATGKVIWERSRSGPKRGKGQPNDVTAPTYARGRVIVAFAHGEVVAFDVKKGKVLWSTQLPSALESSPIVAGKLILIGSDKGILFALGTDDGKRDFQFRAKGPIKSSPSLESGKAYFGDYVGNMYAISDSTGKLQWSTDSTATPGGGKGGFYSSPAIAGGRVYAARDDGVVFAFDADSGKYLWHFKAGGAIYGSPALAPGAGGKLTIFIGSYDAHLYALNAKTGKVSWKETVGPVPGTATVVDRTVYTSSFKTGNTVGYDTKTHKKVFKFPSPGYTPMISDGVRLFLAGYESVHGFKPKSK